MNDLSVEKNSTNYFIDIKDSEMVALSAYERDDVHRKTLSEELIENSCAYDIEYDGCFGASIYFTVHVSDESEENFNNIKRTIREFLDRAAAWKDTK